MDQPTPYTRRKILVQSIGLLLNEIGFDCCEKMALETLTEMFQCFLVQVGELARTYCELTGRTEPLPSDIMFALIDMGISTTGLEQFAKRPNRGIIPTPQVWQPQKQLNMLQAGTKQPLPSYVPLHLPDFPHPHAYIRTPTHKQPVTEYEAIREKAATQKRDMERALTRFVARTGPTNNLFQSEDANIYPLIACKKLYPPYLSALLPQDQIFDPEDLEYDPREYPGNQQQQTEEEQADDEDNDNSRKCNNNKSETTDASVNENETDEQTDDTKDNKLQADTNPNNSNNNSSNTGNPEIDNPYLRATKMPRKKLITKINVTNNTCSTVE